MFCCLLSLYNLSFSLTDPDDHEVPCDVTASHDVAGGVAVTCAPRVAGVHGVRVAACGVAGPACPLRVYDAAKVKVTGLPGLPGLAGRET